MKSTDGDWAVEVSQNEEEGWGFTIRLGKEWLSWGTETGFLRGLDSNAYSPTEEGGEA